MYAASFTLYALSTFYHATGSDAARCLANELFDNIHARSAPDGGVFPESFEVDFATEYYGDQQRNALGHYKGRRTVNTHIHLVEALTAYYNYVGRQEGGDRAGRSRQALKAAADLVVAMKEGPRLVELRDAADAWRPAANLLSNEFDKVRGGPPKYC